MSKVIKTESEDFVFNANLVDGSVTVEVKEKDKTYTADEVAKILEETTNSLLPMVKQHKIIIATLSSGLIQANRIINAAFDQAEAEGLAIVEAPTSEQSETEPSE